MNERIQELLTPKLKEWSGDTDDNFSEELEKFAVSIVRECAKIVNDNDFEGSIVGDNLLFEHFGVNDE